MRASRISFGRWRSAALVAIVGSLMLGIGLSALARPPRERTARPAERTERGTIERFTTAPRGEVDGAVLENGTVIHWPPHVGDRVTDLIAKGDRIEVLGQTETGPEGDTHFEARTIANLKSDKSFDVDDYPPPGPPARGPRGRRGPDRGDAKTIEAKVRQFTIAPRGEVDGAVLDNGTVIHWPPHLQSAFKNIVAEGDRVRASGWMETGPEGDTHLEVRNLTNLGSSASAANEDDGPRSRRAERDRRPDRDERLRALQDQLDQLQREIERLRREQ